MPRIAVMTSTPIGWDQTDKWEFEMEWWNKTSTPEVTIRHDDDEITVSLYVLKKALRHLEEDYEDWKQGK